VVSTLALINEVNLRRTRLVRRWVTVSGSIPGAGHLFQYVTNQPPKANSAFHPSGVGKWVPASAGKAKAGMVHSDSGWTRGVQVKLWDPLRTRAIPERLRGAFTTRRYTNPRLPLPLPLLYFTLLCCGLVGGGGSCRLFVGVTLAHLKRCSTRRQSFYLQQIFGEICLSALSAESIACMIFALVEDFRCISEWVNRSSVSSLVGAILAYWQITVGWLNVTGLSLRPHCVKGVVTT